MQDLHELVEKLKQERDELRVRAHLASAEVKDEWEEAQQKLSHLEARAEKVGGEARDAASDVGDALHLLADEIRNAFRRVRKSMQ